MGCGTLRPERWEETATRLSCDSWRRTGGKTAVTAAVTATAKTGSDADDPQMKDKSLQREQHLQFAPSPGPSLCCSSNGASLSASQTQTDTFVKATAKEALLHFTICARQPGLRRHSRRRRWFKVSLLDADRPLALQRGWICARRRPSRRPRLKLAASPSVHRNKSSPGASLSLFFRPSCHPRLAFVVVLSVFLSGRVVLAPFAPHTLPLLCSVHR